MKPGDYVTCKIPVPAYYATAIFTPSTVGRVACITPKVRITKGPEYDGKVDMIVVDFGPNLEHRCSLNFCNAVKVK